MIYLLLAITIGSHTEQVIPAHEGCENKRNVVYYVDSGLVCVPSDLVFIGDFESRSET